MIRHHHGAILVTVILNQVVGFFWYSPYLFLNPWAAGLGKQVNGLTQNDPLPFVGSIAAAFLSCYVISWLFQFLGVETIRDGASAAIMLWLGIILPSSSAPLHVRRNQFLRALHRRTQRPFFPRHDLLHPRRLAQEITLLTRDFISG